MSNFGDTIQKFIDQSRGKSTGKHPYRPGKLRRRSQILFEKNDPLLLKLGGSTEPTDQGGFGRRKQNKFSRRLADPNSRLNRIVRRRRGVS